MEEQSNSTEQQCNKQNVNGMCFFVGMHNKPGMKPLDSKTTSGKLIDAVIFRLPFTCIKTNLCEVDYMPTDHDEIWDHNWNWIKKYAPETGIFDDKTIVVLLGNWVHKNFKVSGGNIIKLAHPSSCFGRVNKEKYVLNAVNKIKAVLLS